MAGKPEVPVEHRRAFRAGERVETIRGPRRLGQVVPAAPDGFWRCFWCCPGRLVGEATSVADHRFAVAPREADGRRFFLERAADVEDDQRVEFARSEWSPLGAVDSLMTRPL